MTNRGFKQLQTILIVSLVLVTAWRLLDNRLDILAGTADQVHKLLEPGDPLPVITSPSRSARQREVVLFALTTCSGCKLSVPHYQRISGLVAANQQALRLAVVSTESTETVAAWLAENSISYDEIVQIQSFEKVGVLVTPTIVISSADRFVTDVHMAPLSEQASIAFADRLMGKAAGTFVSNVPRELSSRDCDRLINTGTVTSIDVRERSDYASGHRNGAINIPLPELSVRAAVEVPFDRTLMIHGEVPLGFRRMAALILGDLGYSQVILCGERTRRPRRAT